MEPGAGGEPAGPSRGNSAQALPSRRLSLAAVRRWQPPRSGSGMGREARSTCSLPAGLSICTARAWHRRQRPAGTHRELCSREDSFVQLEGCAKPAGKQPGSEQRGGTQGGTQPCVMAVFSCEHSKALLPVSGFTMKGMAGHVGILLHSVPQSLWHL